MLSDPNEKNVILSFCWGYDGAQWGELIGVSASLASLEMLVGHDGKMGKLVSILAWQNIWQRFLVSFWKVLDRQDMGPFRPHSGLTELWQWTEMIWLDWQRGASFMKIHDLNPPCMLRFNALHGRLEEKLPAIMSQRTLDKLDSIHLLSVFKYGSWRKTGKCTCNVLGVHAVLPCKDRCILLAGPYTMLQHWDSPTSPLLRPCAQEILRDVLVPVTLVHNQRVSKVQESDFGSAKWAKLHPSVAGRLW